ncbi:hypothetical protein ACFO3J_09085 [Streptomyces polygonati]|uniref:DUF1579 domain-containing protein n=1 Tax=Streptomyces polygonati TaxID=1617087 RepID=A0ABV8HLG1_9ACTN
MPTFAFRAGRRRAALTLALAALIGAAAGSVQPAGAESPSARPAAHRPTAHPAADPLSALDFLLGDYTCAYTDLTATPPVVSTLSWRTRAVLGGRKGPGRPPVAGKSAYYEMRLSGAAFEGRWVFGWNPVDARYFSFYYDDQATIGRSTSAGWGADGHLEFSGPYSAYGSDLLSEDDITVTDARHFTDHAFIRPDETVPWIPLSSIECARH